MALFQLDEIDSTNHDDRLQYVAIYLSLCPLPLELTWPSEPWKQAPG